MTRGDQITPPPQWLGLVGTFRRFGIAGSVYEILAFDRRLDNGDWMMQVRVVESGEDVEYRLDELLADPSEV